MAKQWGGRFKEKTDPIAEIFTSSIHYDFRLAIHDIRGSIAHARMLGNQGIITKKDSKKIISALKEIEKEIKSEKFQWDYSLEDVHTNIENALIKKIGDIGKKLHTARSRNDQVVTDVRLWLREKIDNIVELIKEFQRGLINLAEMNMDVIIPGYTHLQPAQPVLLSHHTLAYFEMFQRDKERFLQNRKRVNVLTLGSTALAGTTFPIDPYSVAKELGFEDVSKNSMDAVSDRDFAIEFIFNCSLLMMHLSRWAEELIIWSSPQFGFIEIGDAYTTGSSIMPQKKNPDVAELIRGKTGRVYGSLINLLTLMKGLPLTYNRDLQEDKEPLFDVSDTVTLTLMVATGMLYSIRVLKDNIKKALSLGYMEATDLADYLVAKGVPFREAHSIVGKVVLYALEKQKTLYNLTMEEYKQFSPLFDNNLYEIIKPETIVARRNSPGGTSPSQVKKALEEAKKRI
ncbi:MAG: argininosuccinate lyase [Candidatus Hydrogenedentes bacterium]|nr:argininosuccinate lyase [Candidatus Hydrogenedentota bacterium]